MSAAVVAPRPHAALGVHCERVRGAARDGADLRGRVSGPPQNGSAATPARSGEREKETEKEKEKEKETETETEKETEKEKETGRTGTPRSAWTMPG